MHAVVPFLVFLYATVHFDALERIHEVIFVHVHPHEIGFMEFLAIAVLILAGALLILGLT